LNSNSGPVAEKRDANESENGQARQKQTGFASMSISYACRHYSR
jgi:hypothetical protein